MFENSTILITGGTGTFGQAFTREVLKRNPRKVIIYSRDEFKQDNMRREFNDERLRFFLGDVRDPERLHRALNGVDYVVHAAALKQVPACEYNPTEAVKTNVLGAINVVNAAIDCGVDKVVALSTDKAVNPINLYGATKLCAEKIFTQGNVYAGGDGTQFTVVRYGNVAGSRGSVIPLFERLVDEGEDSLPLTDERMTRFYITLQQAVELVFEAFTYIGGEILVPKIPSFRVLDLIKSMGREPEIIGIRPGEKLHETLITNDEARDTYDMGWYYVITPEYAMSEPVGPDFSYSSDNNTEWLYATV